MSSSVSAPDFPSRDGGFEASCHPERSEGFTKHEKEGRDFSLPSKVGQAPRMTAFFSVDILDGTLTDQCFRVMMNCCRNAVFFVLSN
jgi:hypothetical protein